MQHFYEKAIVAKQNNGKADVIDANFLQAVSIAEKITPYKHARLSAVKREAWVLSELGQAQGKLGQSCRGASEVLSPQ